MVYEWLCRAHAITHAITDAIAHAITDAGIYAASHHLDLAFQHMVRHKLGLRYGI